MDIFQTWFCFHRPERRFHQLSYNLHAFSSKLKQLNEKRERIQKKIVEGGKSSNECYKCQGMCCRGDYNHFTAIDHLIRMFSDNPLKDHGDIWKPKSITSIFLDKFRAKATCSAHSNKVQNVKCPHLTPSGCEFEPEYRPIRCVLWTCKAYRQSLPSHTLKEIGVLTKELSSISNEVIRIFSNT